MGSKTFDGIWFTSFSHDHLPPHVHGRYGNGEVVIDLLSGGRVAQSKRTRAIKPSNVKKSDVRRILLVAAQHSRELMELWERAHGTAS